MKLYISEPSERHAGPILVCDEAHNDIAEFFHNEEATVGQNYETALALAHSLVSLREAAKFAMKAIDRCVSDGVDDDLKDALDLLVRALALSRPPGAGVPEPTPDEIEVACAAYAKATGYYVEFHRGLSSESSDRMRKGMRAAFLAIRSGP
jgi:hypothetical protein